MTGTVLRLGDFDYLLAPERIAQAPSPRRSSARLLALDRETGSRRHLTVRDLPSLARPGDLFVFNDTRVLKARFFARKSTGGRVQVLFLRERGGDNAEALLQANHPVKAGEVLDVAEGAFSVRLLERLDRGAWLLAPSGGGTWTGRCDRWGRIPLPPYIQRKGGGPSRQDEERYQTVYAKHPGSVAAPTAGLHFDEALLSSLRSARVQIEQVTLHVGWGTFRPLTQELLSAGRLHPEAYRVQRGTWERIRGAKREGRRIVAVGTTTCRVLETLARGLPGEFAGETDLLIAPGFEFQVVDALFTNFHLPRSTLLLLACAFGGRGTVLSGYREAIEKGYRFYSYGDAMWIT